MKEGRESGRDIIVWPKRLRHAHRKRQQERKKENNREK